MTSTIRVKAELDYKRMLEDVARIVETDFCFDMDSRFTVAHPKFNNEEAIMMAHLLGKIYLVAHCVHCSACQSAYTLPRGKRKLTK